MKKRKKSIGIVLTVVLIFAWGIRFYFVNQDIDIADVRVFQKGVEVPIEKDFFYNSEEDMDGYTVTVLDAELRSVDDFLNDYDASDQMELLGNFTEYIYVVRVSIGNQYNAFVNEKGISLRSYNLKGTDYILSLEDICYQIANPDMPGTSFSLQQGTSMELILPFAVLPELTSRKHLQEDPPKLVISLYPQQKLIELY